MTAPSVRLAEGQSVRVHVRGHDHTGEVVSATRSRVTVSYVNQFGEERLIKLPVGEVVAL
ncbi:Uncharacterised protein (plasmid) [Tsukamurella tyrosinosolvens]|uniref:KOW motif-containing protein n=1 Tax=Tsukamurella tyrosinosolvens TaxID=57704 RepID=A0A1H4VAE1_TSUTY|nr:hypothetical protein [Tsukamurella tyrosinosolvens]KXO91020.1 hypothetical protein AXK58_21560 [Tsukamurella tyrosinosolvens]SEC77471.1 hypothetical protein SAMN04489793_3176 [Tsukamurella tyrosinosolvens]VEH90622.1 Uncharacterised protein [Tsukamurella tyrosinosolvens]